MFASPVRLVVVGDSSRFQFECAVRHAYRRTAVSRNPDRLFSGRRGGGGCGAASDTSRAPKSAAGVGRHGPTGRESGRFTRQRRLTATVEDEAA